MTVSMRAEVVTSGSDELGESPVWLPSEGRLLRVDIHGHAIVSRDLARGTERRRLLRGPVGFALPAAAGGFVAGVGRTLVRLRDLEAGAVEMLHDVEPGRPGNRFTDAACDARGRLWAGTMSTTREPGAASLYRVLASGEITLALAGAKISNGLDWSLDATRLYYVDSPTQRIDAIDFDLDRGRLGRRRPFVAIDPRDGLPDGLTVDAEGAIWVALFGGGAVRRYLPSGRLDAEFRLPVTNPTSVAFGGEDLDELFVTSAKHRLTPELLLAEPLAGSLLRLRPGVRGRAIHMWSR
jgi:sugar lactone lactonase YvrE